MEAIGTLLTDSSANVQICEICEICGSGLPVTYPQTKICASCRNAVMWAKRQLMKETIPILLGR